MRYLRAALLIAFSAFLATTVSAMAPAGTNPRGPKAEAVKKARPSGKTPVPSSAVRSATHFVTKIEGGVLYTERGKYNLSGVKVIDLTGEPKGNRLGNMPKKTAQMTFLNGELREVVIRQRK